MREAKVYDFVTDSGSWEWSRIDPFLPRGVVDSIVQHYPDVDISAEDSPRWILTHSGAFSVRSAYDIICSRGPRSSRTMWRKIWKLQVPQRCKSFLWLTVRGRLLTNVARNARGLQRNVSCDLCADTKEDVIHVLRGCTAATVCWNALLPVQARRHFFAIQGTTQWVTWNVTQNWTIMGFEWPKWFAILSRQLWLNKNARVFNGQAHPSQTILIQSHALVQWSATKLPLGRRESCGIHNWRAPQPGWIKYNVDGACGGDDQVAGCGGFARDSNGSSLEGFMANVGRGGSLYAEVWAVLWGIKRAWDCHWRKVIIETDCLELVELIYGGWSDDHVEGDLLRQITSWLGMD